MAELLLTVPAMNLVMAINILAARALYIDFFDFGMVGYMPANNIPPYG
jgi:hypothetical protein